MTNKQTKEFIDWLGLNYLNFDNEHINYTSAVKQEIREKLEKYEKANRHTRRKQSVRKVTN